MSPLAKINSSLLLLVIMFGALLWFKPGLQSQKTALPITTLDINSATMATVYHGDEIHIQLQRQNEAWLMTHPGTDEIPAERVEQLLHIAELPSLYQFPLEQNRLSEFGLKEPTYQLLLDEQRIQFGHIDPVTRLRYARVGNQIHLISDSYTQYLIVPPSEWTAKK